MPDLNDFYAFKSTSSGNHSSSSGGGGGGCLGALTWAAGIISLLWVIGKLLV